MVSAHTRHWVSTSNTVTWNNWLFLPKRPGKFYDFWTQLTTWQISECKHKSTACAKEHVSMHNEILGEGGKCNFIFHSFCHSSLAQSCATVITGICHSVSWIRKEWKTKWIASKCNNLVNKYHKRPKKTVYSSSISTSSRSYTSLPTFLNIYSNQPVCHGWKATLICNITAHASVPPMCSFKAYATSATMLSHILGSTATVLRPL